MRTILSLILFLLIVGSPAQSQNNSDLPNTPKIKAVETQPGSIKTFIDLTNIVDDKAPVTIDPEAFRQDTVIYRMPKVIPGTYKISDFGAFIDDFKAYDYNGEEMDFTKSDTNSWLIPNATKLDKISYWVNDTFDVENTPGITTPFSPSGTNIESDNVVLNLPGFIGYFQDLESNQYHLEITSPSEFKSSSALQVVNTSVSEDGSKVTTQYFSPRYFDITDNPAMYGNFDIEEFQIGDIKIVFSVYSPNGIHSAKELKETIYTMMEAQKAYLGEINSTARYDIFLYLSEMNESSPTGFGALEHHTSTVVVMPEHMPFEALASSLTDIVSHEFFHIVTPLTIHSEDIHYFDYYEPTFSKHLWLYEGVTEYFSTLFQIDQGLVSEEEFLKKIMDKIRTASSLDDTMSFTEMSENVLVSPYAENYFNVYQKGALIGMCIDILMREESNGNRGILSLMKELSLKYGKNRPFEDDKLIEEIVKMTYPSIGEFFETHVVGKTPIDYNIFFEKVGLEKKESLIETNYIQNNGNLIVKPSADGSVRFNELVSDNSFWYEQGALPEDVIYEINGTVVTLQNAQQVLTEAYMWKPGAEVSVKLKRGGEEILIETVLTPTYTTGVQLVSKVDATKEQLELRAAWMKG